MMELLPNDIRQIVYRFVFDDIYREVREEHKLTFYAHHNGIVTDIKHDKIYQMRTIHHEIYYRQRVKREHGYIFSKFRTVVGVLSPNY